MKQNDVEESQTLTVISSIRKAKSLIKNVEINYSDIHSLDDLIKRIPRDTVVEFQRRIT